MMTYPFKAELRFQEYDAYIREMTKGIHGADYIEGESVEITEESFLNDELCAIAYQNGIGYWVPKRFLIYCSIMTLEVSKI
jgi:hypothetical protein